MRGEGTWFTHRRQLNEDGAAYPFRVWGEGTGRRMRPREPQWPLTRQQKKTWNPTMSDIDIAEPAVASPKRPFRWHIAVFLAPAVLIYTAVMILPLIETLRLSLFDVVQGQMRFVGLANFRRLFGDPRLAADFWNALWNNTVFFAIHMAVQNPIGIALAAMLSIPSL